MGKNAASGARAALKMLITQLEQGKKVDSTVPLDYREDESGSTPVVGCEKCTDGWIRTPTADGRGVIRTECDCLKAEIRRRKIERSGIPDRYWDAKFDLRDDVKAFLLYYTRSGDKRVMKQESIDINRFLEEYASNFARHVGPGSSGMGVMISGLHGSGKSYAGTAILVAALDQNYSICYLTANQLIDAVYNQRTDPKRAQLVKQALEADFLMIDELGRENEGSHKHLADIVQQRYQAKRPTIFTTNFDAQELMEMYKTSRNTHFLSMLDGAFYRVVQYRPDDIRVEQGEESIRLLNLERIRAADRKGKKGANKPSSATRQRIAERAASAQDDPDQIKATMSTSRRKGR